MTNPIIDENEQISYQRAFNSAKQACLISTANEATQLQFNAILDINGSICLSSEKPAQSSSNTLKVGRIGSKQIQPDDFLALLLDPDDVGALIEANLGTDNKSDSERHLAANHFSPNFQTTTNKTILKLEDVLYREDSLDKYLPGDDNDQWYLYGDQRAIDKAIAGPGLQDIHNALLLQQLVAQNFTE